MLKLLPSEKRICTDERTGRQVWQMTRGDAVSHSCYQEVEGFTEDEAYVLFSSNRTGSFQLYRACVQTGELAQLSDEEDYRNLSFGMARNSREAIFVAGWRMLAVDVATGETRLLADLEGKVPTQPSGAPVALSGTGDRCVVACPGGEEHATLAIVMFESGECHEVIQWKGRLSHPQICPSDPDLLTFDPAPDTQNDMSLPMEQRARTWMGNATTGETRPFLITPYGSRATHEYWDYEGRRLYFHRKSVPGWTPTTICSIDRNGEDWQDHVTSQDRKLGHSSIDRQSRFIVSDVQSSDENEVFRFDLETGGSEVLCWPDTSPIQDQTIHVHPSISANANYVDFTSDRLGTPDLYIFPLSA